MGDILFQQLQAALGATYTIERELGGGGMSRVFVATEIALGRLVVVKVITPDQSEGVSAERFAREMKMAARLQQANIVPLLNTGVAEGLPYYTMPFVAGESLRARLGTGQPVALADAINILRDLARALAYAHAQGIVHRDIKPENILLSGGAAVVTDFGIAKAFSASRTSAGIGSGSLTQAGFAVGTPAYMAPEQVAADAGVDHRADLYAWGLIAWELLTGRHPFEDAKSGQALITAHLTRTPPDVKSLRPDVPPALSRLIERCLAKDPDSRPASATDVIAALDQISTTGGGIPTRAVRIRSGSSRRLVVAVIAGIAVVALAGWLLSRRAPAGATASSKSLAVLPFQSPGGDTANSYFAEGMAEEVATALAKVPGLQLAGRNSASAHSGKSPQEIGQLLGVGAVLQGSVRRAGERMRVSVELTNATNGIVMWTESYEREVKDVFAVQDEISREIVSALRMKLGGGASTRMADRGTENMDAYDDYLRGVYQYQRRGAGVQLAVKAFSDAIAKDSSFARAWAGLGQALVSSTEYANVPIGDVLPRAQGAAAEAVRLAPDLAEAHLAAATTAMFADQWAEAEPAFRRAIELDSSLALAHQFFARYLWASGRVEEAVTQALMARTLDPLNAAVLGNLGPILTAAGRREEGFEAARRAFEMDSTVLVAITAYAHSAVAAGKLSEARAFGERVLRYSTDPRARGAAAYALGRGGDTTKARAVYDEMVRRRDEWRTAMARMRAMFGVGDTALALGALEEALQRGEPIAINFSFIDPMFDPVRGSKRFTAVVQGYGLDPAVFTSLKR